jgi:hypothetical protein
VRVFAKEQNVWNCIRFARFDELTLQFAGRSVGH